MSGMSAWVRAIRHDTVAPRGNGVGSKVDGGYSKSSLPGPEVSSSPGERPRASSESPYVAHSAPAPDKTVRPTVSDRSLAIRPGQIVQITAKYDRSRKRSGGLRRERPA